LTFPHAFLLVTDGMGHVDFTSYALIEGRRAAPGYWAEAVPDAVHRTGSWQTTSPISLVRSFARMPQA
jgi:hypothetical protein